MTEETSPPEGVSAEELVSAPVELHAPPAPPAPPSPSAPILSAQPSAEDAEVTMKKLSRRSFLWAGVTGIAVIGGFRWLDTRREEDGIVWPLRRVLELNGDLARDYFRASRLAPTFPASRISPERTNGDVGLGEDFDPKSWKMSVSGLFSGQDLELSLADIQKLPRVEMITEMKCIEGWAIVVKWTGARLADFLAKYPPATLSGEKPNVHKNPADLVPYVGAMTPDGAYYVGLDMESALHPQTLLCWAMNDTPLTSEHGAPLRLVTPTKYGVKHLKRIGSLSFSAQRPADYWAERGYDWYAGH